MGHYAAWVDLRRFKLPGPRERYVRSVCGLREVPSTLNHPPSTLDPRPPALSLRGVKKLVRGLDEVAELVSGRVVKERRGAEGKRWSEELAPEVVK